MSGEKRKAEEDLDEKSLKKKLKTTSSKSLEDTTIPDLIDFSDHEKRKRYHPDIEITSKDDITLYFHINKLVDYPYWDKMINGNMEESKTKKVKLELFDFVTINMTLNYINSKENFTNLIGYKEANRARIVIHDMCEMANYMNMNELESLCFDIIKEHCNVNEYTLKLFEKCNKNKEPLMRDIILGNTIENAQFSEELLSECYDYGMKNSMKDEVVKNIIPIYCPTDEQINLFVYSDYKSEEKKKEDKTLEARNKRIEKAIASREIIQEFLEKHKNNMDNKGVAKFIHKIAGFLFTH